MSFLNLQHGLQLSLLCLCCSLSYILTGCVSPSPKDQALHPQELLNPLSLHRRWTKSFIQQSIDLRNFEHSGLQSYEKTVLYGSRQQGLLSLYLDSHEHRWLLPIQNGVVSPIELLNSTVYFMGGDGYFYAVSADNGGVVWKKELKEAFSSKPVFHEKKIFVQLASGRVVCMSLDTGSLIWDFKYQKLLPKLPIRYLAEPYMVDKLNRLLVPFPDGYLVTLSPKDGRFIEEKKIALGENQLDLGSITTDNKQRVYVPTFSGPLYAYDQEFERIQWTFSEGVYQEVSLDKEHLYVPTLKGEVVALLAHEGSELWRYKLQQGIPGRVLVLENVIVFGSNDRYVYLLDKVTGKLLDKVDVGSGVQILQQPLFHDGFGLILGLSSNGNCYAYEVKPSSRGINFSSFSGK